MQMATICENWEIPYLNISDITSPAEISSKLEETEPKIILASIEDVSDPAIQGQLQLLQVSYIALDECQVIRTTSLTSRISETITYSIIVI